MSETILVVDDEDAIRRTFREWLEGAALGCRILLAEDAEAALRLANEQVIDLAILDWNLGAGNDGLKLLEDLQVFHADVVAIMITGFANQATPVQAMRMGVRDYLDKNQDLNRNTFLRAVRHQLDRIRPARRERLLQQGLREFHDALEKVLPLVQTTTTLQEPLPFPEAARTLLRSLLTLTGARAAYLVVLPEDQPLRVFDAAGQRLDIALPADGQSLASLALNFQAPIALDDLTSQPHRLAFEMPYQSLLALPLQIGPRLRVVVELFDSESPSGRFTEADRLRAAVLAPLAEELLRQAVADRQTRQLLLDAIQAALQSSRHLVDTLEGSPRPEDPPASAILDTIRQGLTPSLEAAEAAETVRLAEAIRVLSVRYGPLALRHCLTLVESLRSLLDQTTGSGEPGA